MSTTTKARKLNLRTLKLAKGAHQPDHTFCVLEARNFVLGNPWSDRAAAGESVVVSDFLRSWNDALDDKNRQMLKEFVGIPTLGARTPALEKRRSWMALDWYCRVSAPIWLRAAGLTIEAEAIEATAPIVDVKSARAAQAALDKAGSAAGSAARSAAWSAAGSVAWTAAGSAAWSAAWSAAGSAAWSAAGSAAWSAAWSVAWTAAWSAAGSAAWSAAWSAAESTLRPTVVTLQKSALQLVRDMIAVSE